jgi:DNA-binding HxlR family transcriptional regulator
LTAVKYAQICKPGAFDEGSPRLSGKWKVQAVWRLSFGPLRFAELRNLLQAVSEKVLTTQLRELEKDGVVTRREVRSSPPKVTYSLSRSGETLIPLLEGLCDWGSKQYGIKPNLPHHPK